MLRMQAPRGHLSVSVDGIVYKIDENGEFDAHPAHKQALISQGYHQKTHRATIEIEPDVTAAELGVNGEAEALVTDEAADKLYDSIAEQDAADEPF